MLSIVSIHLGCSKSCLRSWYTFALSGPAFRFDDIRCIKYHLLSPKADCIISFANLDCFEVEISSAGITVLKKNCPLLHGWRELWVPLGLGGKLPRSNNATLSIYLAALFQIFKSCLANCAGRHHKPRCLLLARPITSWLPIAVRAGVLNNFHQPL